MMRSMARAAGALLGRYRRSRKGNVAMIYALALLPTIAAVGSAIDLTRAEVVKMRLGEALDSAGLAVAGTVGLTQAEMTAKAQKFFYANYPDEELGTVTALTVTPVGKDLVKVAGAARVDTAFMGLFGIYYLDVAVNVEVTRESKGIEIALVLDNTGSMGQNGKLPALKTATNELISILFGDQTNPSLLRMSLVPFSQTVRVDQNMFLNNNWMDGAGQSTSARLNFDNNQYAFAVWATMNNSSWGGCLEARPNGLEELDTAPTLGQPDTRWVPYFEPDGPDSSAYSGYTTYVSDGVNANQETRLKRSAKYVGKNLSNPNTDCNLQKILPLTNNKALLQSYVNGMIASGNTHIALGAAWGWRTLSPTPPFVEGSAYDDPDWKKVMVFLTDGLNTTPSNSTFHKSNYTAYNFLVRGMLGTTSGPASETEQDNRTKLVCDRIKTAGIDIITILLEEDSSRAVNLMEECASTPEGGGPKMAYVSPSAGELKKIFQEVALYLSNLRLSK